MVTLATNNPTLADIAKGLDPDEARALTTEMDRKSPPVPLPAVVQAPPLPELA